MPFSNPPSIKLIEPTADDIQRIESGKSIPRAPTPVAEPYSNLPSITLMEPTDVEITAHELGTSHARAPTPVTYGSAAYQPALPGERHATRSTTLPAGGAARTSLTLKVMVPGTRSPRDVRRPSFQVEFDQCPSPIAGYSASPASAKKSGATYLSGQPCEPPEQMAASPTPKKEPNSPIRRPFFDNYTLLQWFMEMDHDQSGHVTKESFMEFLRNRPQLKNLMLGLSPNLKEAENQEDKKTKREEVALEMRRLLKVLKAIDGDGNGTFEWEEFVEFFRRSGYLLEYATEDNPRDSMAEIMGQIHYQKTLQKSVDANLVDDLNTLAKEHLTVETRRKSKDLASSERETGRRASAFCGSVSLNESKIIRKNLVLNRRITL